jgi:hypothetical protein
MCTKIEDKELNDMMWHEKRGTMRVSDYYDSRAHMNFCPTCGRGREKYEDYCPDCGTLTTYVGKMLM